MKDFIFISDFDGTLTNIDFYQILIDKYLKEKGQEALIKWREGITSVSMFLNEIFTAINLSEEEILEDIKEINFDESSFDFINKVRANNGDFLILSAGTSYYIKRLLKYKGIENIEIIANKGIYDSGGILMQFDQKSEFYSKESGIDKAKVVKKLRKEYKRLYYAGDGYPDYQASIQADIIFAKVELKTLLINDKIPFVDFSSFDDINKYLTEIGVIKWLN